MHPILFELGGFTVHSYGALGAAGFLAVCGIALYRAAKLGIEPERLADLIFFTSLISLLGARLLFVWQNPEAAESWLDVVNYRKGGLVFYGALLVGIPVGTLWMLFKKMPLLAVWDVFATAMPVGHGITRLGCLMAGCCWGTESSVPWAVTFDHELAIAPHGIGLHPVQAYEALSLFVLGAILNLTYGRRRFDGQVLGMYLLGYAAVRVVTEMYRGDATRGFFLERLLGEALSYSQGVSIGIGLLGLAILMIGRSLKGPPAPSVATG